MMIEEEFDTWKKIQLNSDEKIKKFNKFQKAIQEQIIFIS
jgi:hypothetical protein